MDPITAPFEIITGGITGWIMPMLLTVVSSIITIMMVILAGALILGLLRGGDGLSMGVGSIIGSFKRSFDDYGENNDYQRVLGEEKQKMRTEGLRERARAEIRGKE